MEGMKEPNYDEMTEFLQTIFTDTVKTVEAFTLCKNQEHLKNHIEFIETPFVYMRVYLMKLLIDELESDICTRLRKKDCFGLIESTKRVCEHYKKEHIALIMMEQKRKIEES
jgi:hypothetical protein